MTNNTTNNSGDFIVDGGININDNFEQNGGKLFSGHPVPHAVTSQSVANTLKKLGDDSVLTQPVSFTQDDWETRQFSLKSLVLKDTAFYLDEMRSSLLILVQITHLSPLAVKMSILI